LLKTAPAFAAFGETMIYWALAVAAFLSVDHFVFKDIDTISEIKKGNVAYAITLCAVAILLVGIANIVG
jgi:hypothetical protein